MEFLIGTISGIISGFFGAGGGMIIVPSLVHILKKDEVKSRATATFTIIPIVIASGVIYIKNSHIDWGLSIKIVIGGIIGGYIGAKLLKKLPEKFLKISFALFIIFMGIKMIL